MPHEPAPPAVILVRALVGGVFLSEGIQKFLFPAARGFWAAAHEARTDYCMLLGSIFLVAVGGGRWSLDARAVGSRAPQ
jgi:uncharacterized membrane protein YphA (DoxX/SURF4 family)